MATFDRYLADKQAASWGTDAPVVPAITVSGPGEQPALEPAPAPAGSTVGRILTGLWDAWVAYAVRTNGRGY